jgi:diguanylate cyclase (GGDEF)-like protein/PAS domain S-box-containing protein
MVAYWDIDQVCVFANNAYRAWFGKTREEVVGHTLQELLGPLYPMNLPYIRAAYGGQKQVFEREIPCPDGTTRYSLATYTPNIVNGRLRGIFVHVADVTPLKKMELELQAAIAEAEHLATHDFLTGLPNRVLLGDRLEQAIAAAQRKREMVAVLSIDLDDFKKINDSHGHAEGDRLLVEIASRIKSALRESDTLTRLGGDEFLLLAAGIRSAAQAGIIADHVLERVNQPFQAGGTTISPAVSLGIAIYPRDGTSPDALLVNSDRAMYAAKSLGKNLYAFANQDPAHSPDAQESPPNRINFRKRG